jgi:predicted porin
MKKHLIAAAVAAAVAAPSMAQVTVSGNIDSGYLVRKDQVGTIDIKRNETGNASAVSTSTLNFSASEDLGGGLTARAFHNVSLNSNTGGEGARDTWVSIGGGFGEFKTGRFTPAFESNASIYSVGSNTVNSASMDVFAFKGSAFLMGISTDCVRKKNGQYGFFRITGNVFKGIKQCIDLFSNFQTLNFFG